MVMSTTVLFMSMAGMATDPDSIFPSLQTSGKHNGPRACALARIPVQSVVRKGAEASILASMASIPIVDDPKCLRDEGQCEVRHSLLRTARMRDLTALVHAI